MKKIKQYLGAALLTVATVAVVSILCTTANVPQAHAADTYRAGVGAQTLLTSASGEAYFRITNSTACNMTNAIIDATQGKELCLHYRSQLTAAGTANQLIFLQISSDRQNWQDYRAVGIAGNGTAYVNLVTNLSVLGYPYVRVLYVTNAEASAITTNWSVKYFVK